jgi:hypothetical protein
MADANAEIRIATATGNNPQLAIPALAGFSVWQRFGLALFVGDFEFPIGKGL